MPEKTSLFPMAPQKELELFPCNLRWVQVEQGDDVAEICCAEMLKMVFETGSAELSISEVIFIADNKKLGMEVEGKINDKNIQTITTFSEDRKKAQRKKMAFYMGDARVKMTTIHSFKGWETRALVLFIGKASSNRDMSLVYTAMTRLCRNDKSSSLTVVCAAPTLKEYGKSWPSQ